MFPDFLLHASLLLHAFDNQYAFLLLVALTALAIGWRSRAYAFAFFISLATATLLSNVLKIAFAVERPEDALVVVDTYRFPSTHAAVGGAFIMSVYYFSVRNIRSPKRRMMIGLIAALSILFICVSRLVLGVHKPVDVIAGTIIGVGIAWVVHRLLRRELERIF